MPRDLAIETALDVLRATVCECGHLNTEHVNHEPRECLECLCFEFRAVNFFVTRADARDVEEDA